MDSRPSENALYHLNTCDLDKACSPYACFSLLKVSMPVSPSLTQNLIAHCCSKLRSSISVTHTHTHKNCFTRNHTKISVLTLASWNSYWKSMRLLSNLHVKGEPAVLPDRAIRRQSHYFIYRPRIYIYIYQLRWSRGSVLAFGTQVCGFRPSWSCRIFKGEKILSTPSFGGEVKPSVPCHRFAACKRSLELRGSRILDEICQNISRPRRVPPPAARGLSCHWTWRHLAERVIMSKGRGKQWQPTPKNLPRMQCARAIPVAWLGSGSC